MEQFFIVVPFLLFLIAYIGALWICRKMLVIIAKDYKSP
jgi:hypothetical protein